MFYHITNLLVWYQQIVGSLNYVWLYNPSYLSSKESLLKTKTLVYFSKGTRTSLVILNLWQESPTKLSSFSKWNYEKIGYCQTSRFLSVQNFVWNWKAQGFFGKTDSKVIVLFCVPRRTSITTTLYIFYL